MTDAAEAEATEVAPEEVPAEIEEQKPAEEAEAQQEPSGDETTENEERERKRNSFQERISQKTRQVKEAEQRAKEAEERAQLLEQRLQEQLGDVQNPPKLSDFDYDEEKFQQALGEYYSNLNARNVQKAMSEQEKLQAEAIRRQHQQAVIEAFKERSMAFSEEHPDFQQKISAAPLPEIVQQVAVLSEEGPALAYHYASNPHKAAELQGLPPVLAALEIGKTLSKLTAPPPVRTTQTPQPIKPVSPSGSVDKDPDKMTPEEYRDWRMKQKRG